MAELDVTVLYMNCRVFSGLMINYHADSLLGYIINYKWTLTYAEHDHEGDYYSPCISSELVQMHMW